MYGGVLAPSPFQEMGIEAQTNVGIPMNKQLPIKQGPYITNPSNNGFACAASLNIDNHDAIYLMDKFFSCPIGSNECLHNGYVHHLLYSFQRCILHHEAVHVKYSDQASLNERSREDELHPRKNNIKIIGATMLCAAPLILLQKKTSTAVKALETASFYVVLNEFFSVQSRCDEYSKFCEHRADTEGFLATKCYACLNDHALIMSMGSSSRAKQGYLTADEIRKIALDFKQQNKLCSFHHTYGASPHIDSHNACTIL